MTAWSEYIVAAQVLQERDMFTLPLGLKSFQASLSTEWGLYAAAAILVSIPVVIVFMLLSRYLVSGLTIGAVKSNNVSVMKKVKTWRKFACKTW